MQTNNYMTFILIFLLGFCYTCYSDDDLEKDLLHKLTSIKGDKYINQRNLVLSNSKSLEDFLSIKTLDSNEILQKEILKAWGLNHEIYKNIIKGFSGHEDAAKYSVKPFTPRPVFFAKKWNKYAGNKLVFFALEVVWKYDNWAEWRILAMLEILKSHADDEMLPVIADRLLTEKNKKIIASIVQVLKTRAGKKTLEHLKSLAKNKNGNNELILDCVKTITDRMSTDKKQ